MTGRPRTWNLEEGVVEHKITMRCPKALWKELQGITLAQDTSATALVIKAVEQFLESERKEEKAQKKPKKAGEKGIQTKTQAKKIWQQAGIQRVVAKTGAIIVINSVLKDSLTC